MLQGCSLRRDTGLYGLKLAFVYEGKKNFIWGKKNTQYQGEDESRLEAINCPGLAFGTTGKL